MWGFREPLDNKSQLEFIKGNVDKDVHGWSERTFSAMVSVGVLAVVLLVIAFMLMASE